MGGGEGRGVPVRRAAARQVQVRTHMGQGQLSACTCLAGVHAQLLLLQLCKVRTLV